MKKLLFVFFVLGCFSVNSALAQNRMITGKVTASDDGSPLPQVSINIKGTQIGVPSDLDGNYSIEVPSSATVLVYRFLGYITKEITIGNQTNINVTLDPDITALQEVLVVGFGTQSKRNLTDNIAKLDAKQLKDLPTAGFQNAFAGQTAGVSIQQTNGKVDGATRVRVRGVSSISSSTEPLYVVDGVPITNNNESTNGAAVNPLLSINPSDIQSVQVLKDASSAAIYGARGSNGVILITTKRGESGRAKITLNLSSGISRETNRRDWLNRAQYIELFREANANSGGSNADIEGDFDFLAGNSDWRTGEVDTDWQDLVFVDGYNRNSDLSISGGDDNTRFFFSGGYTDIRGIIRGNDLERISTRMNIDHKFSDRLSVGMGLSISKSSIDRLSNDNAFATPLQAIAQSPLSPAYNADGTPNPNTLYYNFLIEDEDANYLTSVWRTLANVNLKYRVLPSLDFVSEAGYDLFSQSEDRFWGRATETGQSVGGQGFVSSVRTENLNLNNYLNYGKDLAADHYLELTAGFNYQTSTRKYQDATGVNFASDDLQTLASAGTITAATSNLTEFAFLSYFGRANYTFRDKYLVKLSARYDGSSRFGANNRYGFFPAASVGWIASQEDFLSNVKNLSFLKLRASYGETGNAEIGNFASLGLFGTEAYRGEPGLKPTQLGNEDLKWERTNQLDIGVEFGFLENRISGEIDYYSKETNDLLLAQPLPSNSGFTSILKNVGSLTNKGFEFLLNTKNINTTNFSWGTSLNFFTNKNEVTRLPGGDIISGQNIVREGESLASFYIVEFGGVDPANGDALFVKNTENPDGTIDRSTTNNFSEASRIIAGQAFPKWEGGITNSFTYNNFDFMFTFQLVNGHSIYNSGGRFQEASGDFYDNQDVNELNRWQNPGDITNVPQARLFGGNGTQHSTRYLQEASYVRLRTVTLGYNVPQSVIDKIGMSRARVYFSGFNLLTFTDYTGYDPESTADFNSGFTNNIALGQAFYSAPQAKTYTFGINIEF
tara:strand:- start:60505 stop:63522 length:3018 start_codon:yes stop_codon:yes gene_type:complete